MTPQEVFDKLNALDYEIVYYKLGRAGFEPEKIERMRRECLRFLALCATNTEKGRSYTPTPLIDEFWHNMILCTYQYRTVVAEICGRYIDHSPDKSDEQKKQNFSVSIFNTLEDYEKYFGVPDLELWGLTLKEGVKV